MQQLNRAAAQCPARLTPKVLQFGGGNFLRAFVDWTLQAMNDQLDFDAGVIVVKPTERGDYSQLRNQDGLFHILTQGIFKGKLVSEVGLVSCVQDVIHPYRDWKRYLDSAVIPSIRFVISNTTEQGITFNPEDYIAITPPREFPAKLTHWLYARYVHFKGDPGKGCIFIPCELIVANGQELKQCILQYAAHWRLEPGFIDWINNHNIFCDTLVDRIVPGYPKAQEIEFREKTGFEDPLLAAAEPYHLWVIQGPDQVKAEFPADRSGRQVIFTKDLTPYQVRKVRILNGAHTAMVPIGYLAGIRTVRETLEDDTIGPFIEQLLREEVQPTLDLPPAELEEFTADVLDRFRNPFLEHQLIAIALNSTSKFKARLLPSLLEFVERKKQLPQRIVIALAALIRMYKGTDLEGQSIALKDEPDRLQFFREIWQAVEADALSLEELVQAVLGKESYWGIDLSQVKGLPPAVTQILEDMETRGWKLETSIQHQK